MKRPNWVVQGIAKHQGEWAAVWYSNTGAEQESWSLAVSDAYVFTSMTKAYNFLLSIRNRDWTRVMTLEEAIVMSVMVT